ncbi:MAG: hypothetical protein KIT83_15570 [Bryobacterales bacterium]|nr:hypothetical protein [Bryobacterales bacterium]
MFYRLTLLLLSITMLSGAQPQAEYQQRVEAVRAIQGLAAFWDFVLREPQTNRFLAHTPSGPLYPLNAANYVRDYWQEGRAATYDDFPILGVGPFGQGVRILDEPEATFRPTLLLERARFHDGPLDVGGPGRSVSMAVWMVHQEGNHAVAGIWHEGTDLQHQGGSAARVETGRRQYALFTGLAANRGASAVHVSENGRSSFGDRYARNLATTKRLIPSAGKEADDQAINDHWSVAGFVFDNQRNVAIAYLDGEAEDFWIEEGLFEHPFFKWPANGWKQAQLRRMPGLQDGEDPDFPGDQFYAPPEERPLRRKRIASTSSERIWEHTYEYTRVRVTERRTPGGVWEVTSRELIALRVNPFWFGHDLYKPRLPEEGGPFTIGRVIHSSRSVGTVGVIGGVAVYNRALTPAEMRKLAAVGFSGNGARRRAKLLRVDDLAR